MVQKTAIAIGSIAQSLQKVWQPAYVIAVQAGELGDLIGLLSMMG
jgi:hypothetical protein